MASSRLPGKPLADIGGEPMICHVVRRVEQVLPGRVWVATDHRDIYDAVSGIGGHAVMTSVDCPDGTSRVAEAAGLLGIEDGIIVNVQGDEPFINPSDFKAVVAAFANPAVEIVTLARRFEPEEGLEALLCPDLPKVAFDSAGDALYFSRSVIPCVRGVMAEDWLGAAEFYVHIGLYAFRCPTLHEVAALPAGRLERAERLEQLRWLEAGKKIRVVLTESRSIGVDTLADLRHAREVYARQHH